MKRPPGPVRQRLRKGAYLLPSLFTMGNIILGFYAVIRGLEGDFLLASMLLFGAGILDGLDGRIARLTHTESEFGKEFDSLADVLTFGMAPALLAYLWVLREMERAGWLLAVFFLLCTAIRLARYNVQTKIKERDFVGLPSPAAAGVVASLLFLAFDPTLRDLGLQADWIQRILPFMMVIVGSLMVSTFRYPGFRGIDLRKRLSYRGFFVLAAVVLMLVYYPEAFFPLIALIYWLLGPLGWLFGRFWRRPAEPIERPTETAETLETT